VTAFFGQGGYRMSLDFIKNSIHQGVNEIVAAAALDEMTGDTDAYSEKVATLKNVAEVLGIDMEV